MADAIGRDWDYGAAFCEWATKYPACEYSADFMQWLEADMARQYPVPAGNGAARISPIGWLYEPALHDQSCGVYWTKREVFHAVCSIGEAESVWDDAKTVALAMYFARCGASKEVFRRKLCKKCKTMEELREGLQSEGGYCAGTTLAALSAFMESHDFVSAIQNAISLGGDPSTTACITGSIAEAFYKEIPQELIDFVKSKLPEEMITTLEGTSPDYTAYCTEDEIPLIQERVSQQLQGV